MRLKILAINPWIYDFAAMNLWSKPLGLYCVAEYLSQFETELSVIDCLGYPAEKNSGRGKYRKESVAKPDCVRLVPRKYGRYGISISDFQAHLQGLSPFDAVIITSIMAYWYPGVQKAVELVKEVSRDVPVILGGIYATLWPGHAAEVSGADFIYKGPVSDNIKFAFSTFGFRLKKRSGPIPCYHQEMNAFDSFAPVMTSIGCPYACSYCASPLLSTSFSQKDPDTVIHDIKELYRRGTRDFAFYDDALLVNADLHIKVILREMIRNDLAVRFHCPNGLHAKFIDDELALLMKQSGFRMVRLSLETVDRKRQIEIGRKVTSDDLIMAVKTLKKHGFIKDEVGVYLMYGLPGQTLAEVHEGIEFLKSLDVRINLTEFSPIPGTGSWNDLIRSGTINRDLDPLLTNNTVYPYLFSGYDPDDVMKIKLDVKKHNMTPGFAVK